MAGLWERIANSSGPQEHIGRIGINQIEAALVQNAAGMYTPTEIKTKIDLRLASKGHEALDVDEIADFTTLVAVLDSQASMTLKLIWLLKLRSMLTDAEMGLCDETEFRAKMEMTL